MQPPTSTCGNLHLVGTLPKLRSQFPDPDQLYRPKRFYHWLVARAHVTCVFLNLSWEDDPTWLIFLGCVETTSQTTKMWFLSMCRSETSNMSTDTSSLGIWNSRLISWGISFPLPPKRSRKPWKTIFHYLGRIFFILLDLLPSGLFWPRGLPRICGACLCKGGSSGSRLPFVGPTAEMRPHQIYHCGSALAAFLKKTPPMKTSGLVLILMILGGRNCSVFVVNKKKGHTHTIYVY